MSQTVGNWAIVVPIAFQKNYIIVNLTAVARRSILVRQIVELSIFTPQEGFHLIWIIYST